MGDFGGRAPFLPGKLAVEFVDAVEEAAEEDGEDGQFVELLFFFQAGGGKEADGEMAVGDGLLDLLAGLVDGRPLDEEVGDGDEGVAGGQAGLLGVAEGVNGGDVGDGEAA